MATTEQFYTGDGSTTNFTFPFEYITKSDVKVSLNDVETTAYTYANATTIQFTSAPADQTRIRIFRYTDVDDLKATFSSGSSIRAKDLNDNFQQNNFAVEEIRNYSWDNEVDTIHSDETWVSDDLHIATTEAMDEQFWDQTADTIQSTESFENTDDKIMTAAAIDDRIDFAITNDIGTDGTGITVTDDGDGTITLGLADDSIDFSKIKDADIIDFAEQDAGTVNPSDDNIFTANAAARRFDAIVQTAQPGGSNWQTGKLWYQNDEDQTVYMWDGNSWEAITSGGAFTRLDQVIYVDSINGNDNNNGHRISSPKQTIRAAIADINADATNGDGATVVVAPGIYAEEFPINIQRNDVSIVGTSLRNCIIHPAIPANAQAGYDVGTPEANELETMFRVNSGTYLANLTFMGMKAAGARGGNVLDTNTVTGLPTNQGWNIAFFPGATIRKSPYIQNCTNFSDSRINNVNFNPHTQTEGAAGDLTSDPTGGGILIDGSQPATNSPLRSMVCDSYTHTALDGPGIFVTNNGYCQATSSYSFFNHYHLKCLNGGQANLAASTTDFGRFSLIADGRSTTPIFTAQVNGSPIAGATSFNINNLQDNWFGTATRPQDNMLVEIGADVYSITSAVDLGGNTWTVNIIRPDPDDRTENLGLINGLTNSANVNFYLRSMIASSGHTMEYVGSGTDYDALPQNGGVPVDANQITEANGGKIWAATTDHKGTFRVGDTFEVDQETGFVNIPAGALSVSRLLADLDTNGFNIVNNDGVVTINDTLSLNSNRITNVTDPTNAQDAATKAYVDQLESDLDGGQLDTRYFRQDSSETISSGDTWSGSDSFVATTAAIDARIIDLVDDVGGFVAITDETSFPAANPDVNNGTGTVVSIKEIATSRTPSSGTVTIANGAGSNTVTITGCGTTVLAAGYGCIVETTSTLHTYTFHRLTPLATEVSTVAANVTDISTVADSIDDVNTFAAVYQVAENADPTQRADSSALQEGDLVYREDLNVIRAYNGTSYQNITPDSATLADIAIVADDLATFEDLGLITDSLTAAQSGGALETCADNIADIRTLADIEDGTDATDAIQNVNAIRTNVTTVAGVSANVTTVANSISNVNTVANDLNEDTSEIDTVATNITNVNTVGNAISNVNTVANNINDVNNFADLYTIDTTQPANPSEGDLWYDDTNNILKYYNGTSFASLGAGISDVQSDTTPELGGNLDCNGNDLTEVGTINGTDLTIDFGTI